MKVSFLSLGCAKNLVNAEQMMARVQAAGHTVSAQAEGSDVVVVNTCGFIDAAKEEAIDAILEMAALKAAGGVKKLVVTGCLSQRYRDELLDELPEVDGALGTGSYTDIVPALEAVMAGERPALFGDIHHTAEDGPRVLATPGYTAYLKIAEGCDHRCAYCVIPALRGRYRSRSMESLLAEAEELARRGVGELIVVAQDITRYGTDLYGESRLARLLEGLCRLPFHWVRLHYLYPDAIDDELIRVIAEQPKIVKYLDIPIQHIDDGILRAMRRGTSRAQIEALLAKLRGRIPGVVIRTSLICGLPGEGEEEFDRLCGFLQKYRLERAGVFPFSPEEGTPAASMPGQVEEETARRRVELVRELQARVMDEHNRARLGGVEEVLCEGFAPDMDEGCYAGRTYADSPDVDGRVLFTAPAPVAAGTFVRVRLTGVSGPDLTGEAVE